MAPFSRIRAEEFRRFNAVLPFAAAAVLGAALPLSAQVYCAHLKAVYDSEPVETEVSRNNTICDDGARCGRVVETTFSGTHCVETAEWLDCQLPGLPNNLRKKTRTTYTCQYVGIWPFGQERCVGTTIVLEWQTDVATFGCG